MPILSEDPGTFPYINQAVDREIADSIYNAAWPADLQQFHDLSGAQPKVQAEIVL